MAPLRWKRILVVLAALLLVAACSSDDEEPDRSSEDTTVSNDESTPTEPDANTTDADGPDVDEPDAEGPDPGDAAALTTLTPRGLGPVTIGMSQDAAVASGLVESAWEVTCELSGAEETTALLLEPLVGQVTAMDGSVDTILVIDRSVTTDPGGVGVGTPRGDAEAAFGTEGVTMTVDESTVETMGEFFWTATDGSEVLFAGSIDPATGEVTAIATPRIPICE